MSAQPGSNLRRLIAPIAAPLTHLALTPAEGEGQPPGLLMLHGRGADEHDLLGLAGALDPRLLVVSARAPLPLGWGHHWYELLDIGRPDLETFARSLSLLHEFIPQVVAGYNIDPQRLYLLGFSQGAMMSGAVVLTRPELAAGAVLLSGYLPLHAGPPIQEERLAGYPFFVAHGSHDPVIPVAFGREARDFLTRAGTDLTYREYPSDHRIVEPELAEVAAWLTARIGGGE
jgi:phospholipase/carboxylesterase